MLHPHGAAGRIDVADPAIRRDLERQGGGGDPAARTAGCGHDGDVDGVGCTGRPRIRKPPRRRGTVGSPTHPHDVGHDENDLELGLREAAARPPGTGTTSRSRPGVRAVEGTIASRRSRPRLLRASSELATMASVVSAPRSPSTPRVMRARWATRSATPPPRGMGFDVTAVGSRRTPAASSPGGAPAPGLAAAGPSPAIFSEFACNTRSPRSTGGVRAARATGGFHRRICVRLPSAGCTKGCTPP